jgi:hypothetical protein
MKTFKIILTSLTLTLFLAACGTVGKNFNDEMVTEIKPHATTKTEILDWFGVPFKEGVENGNTMWTYQYDQYNALGEPKSKDLVILFDSKDVVKAYRYTSNAGVK